jgi:surface protein
MDTMFKNNKKFNQPLDKWNVSNVTNMDYMFNGDSNTGVYLVFNQNISGWNVNKVTTYTNFALDSALEDDYLPNF